ncbi:MAG: hypothetical protein FJ005_07185 [Chloroflexi bacterium]|nr:hypothetical protein [Chloroflexota bacterium]
MRFILLVLAVILVLGLLTTGFMLAPCQATASNFSANEATPIITNATLSNEEITPSKVAFQASYLSLSLRTDKPAYLTGETVAITVSTSVSNTRVRVLAQLSGGYQETIGNFTTSGIYTLSWPAPSTSGQVKFTCEGEAIVQVWSTCTRIVCVDKDCWWETYPCLQSTTVTGNAFYDIRVFSRATSISGSVNDTNQRPIPGATVYALNARQGTTASSDGHYEFSSYQLSNNYNLINQIPTVTETVSAEAIASEPQPGKTVQVQAERGATDVNFTLKRYFYPPAIDLSEFTFDTFSGWKEAKESSTWQNILGITIDGPVEPRKLLYGTKEISPPLFNIGNKKLYLITKPEFGRYFLELQGAQNTEYTVAAATTLNSYYFEPVSVSGRIEAKDGQRLRLMLEPDRMELKVIKPPSLLLLIIPTVVGLVGGLVAAYFLTGGKFRGLKLPWLRKTTQGRAQEKTRRKGRGKKGKKK